MPRLLAITAVLVSCLSAQRSTANIAHVFARYGIHAVTAATPGGDAELIARLGPDVMASLADVRPHVAMLRNDGPHAVLHVIWIWWGITHDGKRIPMGNETAVGAEGIKPADFAIATPSFPLTRLLMHRAKQPRANLSGLPVAVQELKEDFARRYTAVEATLDSVILNNGTIVGPDHYGFLESRRAQNAAIAELSVKINDASMSDAQLDAWLAEVTERPFTLTPNGLPNHASGIGSSARMARVAIKQHGRAKVAGLYSQLAQKNATAKQLIQVKE